jgi:DNA-binding beta-propeller fold protein YncE
MITNLVINTIRVAEKSRGIVYKPANHRIYVTNLDDNIVFCQFMIRNLHI